MRKPPSNPEITKPRRTVIHSRSLSTQPFTAETMILDNTTTDLPNQLPIYDLFGNDITPAPLGFINSKLSPTSNLPDHTVNRSELSNWQYNTLKLYEELHEGCGVGIAISQYSSGEFSGACTNYGPRLSQPFSKPSKRVSTTKHSISSQKNMKRGVQNHIRPFNRFCTLTFDPSRSQLTEDGLICHQYAHIELSRFLEALTRKYSRRAELTSNPIHLLSYIWSAELQENGNIHFHILFDKHLPIQLLTKLWKQANNSVDIKPRTGMKAINYLLSYMKKDKQSLIYGKRYGMSQNLYTTSKPFKIIIRDRGARAVLIDYLQNNFSGIYAEHGYKCDWGFNLPPPSRRSGHINPYQQRQFITGLAEQLAEYGFPQLLTHLTGDNQE